MRKGNEGDKPACNLYPSWIFASKNGKTLYIPLPLPLFAVNFLTTTQTKDSLYIYITPSSVQHIQKPIALLLLLQYLILCICNISKCQNTKPKKKKRKMVGLEEANFSSSIVEELSLPHTDPIVLELNRLHNQLKGSFLFLYFSLLLLWCCIS